MAHRFLYGIDDLIEGTIVDYFVEAIKNLSAPLGAQMRLGRTRQAALDQTIENYARDVQSRYRSSASKRIKSEYFSSVEEMVRLMPKQDMANLAEALVNITIIKRKASSEQETVGGPIDVAVISRHEGFVWVKRKHYFSAELNPRYFWRHFKLPTGGTR